MLLKGVKANGYLSQHNINRKWRLCLHAQMSIGALAMVCFLPGDHLDLHQCFGRGFPTSRSSDHCLAAASTDVHEVRIVFDNLACSRLSKTACGRW